MTQQPVSMQQQSIRHACQNIAFNRIQSHPAEVVEPALTLAIGIFEELVGWERASQVPLDDL